MSNFNEAEYRIQKDNEYVNYLMAKYSLTRQDATKLFIHENQQIKLNAHREQDNTTSHGDYEGIILSRQEAIF